MAEMAWLRPIRMTGASWHFVDSSKNSIAQWEA